MIKSHYTSPNSPWAVLKRSEINFTIFPIKVSFLLKHERSYFDPSQAQYMDKILKKKMIACLYYSKVATNQGEVGKQSV